MKQILLEQIPDNAMEACAKYLNTILYKVEPPDNLENAPVVDQLFKEVNAVKSRLITSDTNQLSDILIYASHNIMQFAKACHPMAMQSGEQS